MALAILKAAGAIGRGIGNFIKKRAAKKDEKIQKKIDAAVKKQGTLAGLVGEQTKESNLGGAMAGIQSAAASLFGGGGAAGAAERAKEDGSVIGGKAGMPTWLLPVAIVVALLFLPKLLKGLFK